ncbi:hypothetical protein RDWZM_008039 [Blomia tropicalis]|uniref:Integrin alpha second immunoglobulin-like domain-containing protein n=1 Tax=Blomia tropicalis TaxID=40697 RepID=A0A9Q0M2S6_BLOTA|nr:hypothetical protein RDWZM_008039 [Blomia tropicalis]
MEAKIPVIHTLPYLENRYSQLQLILDKIYARSVRYVARNRSLIGFNLETDTTNVYTCAPNWVSNSETSEGICFTLDNISGQTISAFKLEPKKRILSQRPYESHSLFGFSIVSNKADQTIVASIPGFNDFGGSIAKMPDRRLPERLKDLKDSSPNSYAGFSVALMQFDRVQAIVFSTPRYNKYRGKVTLIDYDSNDVILTLLSVNATKGEFFGSSLLVIGNSLLVGAPLYSSRNRRDVGRVYYYQSIQLQNRRQQHITFTAKNSGVGAHFGTNMASIDLNMDNFIDVIISAPYEVNNDGSIGAIYIYYGRMNEIDTTFEKKIGAEEFPKLSFRGFGYSLWTRTDIDKNGYNDLIIGSILSEKVIVLRSFPIFNLTLNVWFDRKGVNLSTFCENGNPCFVVNYCILTNAKRNLPSDQTYSVQFLAYNRKIRAKENRVIVNKMNSLIDSNRNRTCMVGKEGFMIDLKKKEDLYDIITPIEIQMSVSLVRPTFKQFCPWCPIAQPFSTFNEIRFEHGCAHKVCIAQLHLDVQLKYGSNQIIDSIVHGKYNNIEMVVDVQNFAESSIDTQFRIKVVPLINMINLDVRCRLNEEVYYCEVNKLLEKNQKEEFRLFFDVTGVVGKSLNFDMLVSTNSELASESRTTVSKRFNVTKEASFKLFSNNQYNFSFSDQTTRVMLPISLLVEKDGPSSVESSKLTFELPGDVLKIDQSSKFTCTQLSSSRNRIIAKSVINETLFLSCVNDPDLCSKFECLVGAFQPGRNSINFDITLLFQPNQIAKLQYKQVLFDVQFRLYAQDVYLESEKTFALMDINMIFERKMTQIQSKASPLIMIGGGGIGLLILLITVIILIKRGFFKRKKREELLRTKQRMSMNPNLILPPGFTNVDLSDNITDEHI